MYADIAYCDIVRKTHYRNVREDAPIAILHTAIMSYPFFLKEWRNYRGLTHMSLAERVGTSQSYVSQIETRERRFNEDWLARFADALDCTPVDLLSVNPLAGLRAIPIIGKVFAGPEGSYIDDYADGSHPTVEPFDLDDRVAAIVDGESMLPRFRPGETLIFGPARTDPTPLINTEVMATLSDDDGKKLIKVLRPNKHVGFWDLYSINSSYQVIEGVQLSYVRPFEGLRV
jgi:transcriptional regulator with XRE-family HTH domain